MSVRSLVSITLFFDTFQRIGQTSGVHLEVQQWPHNQSTAVRLFYPDILFKLFFVLSFQRGCKSNRSVFEQYVALSMLPQCPEKKLVGTPVVFRKLCLFWLCRSMLTGLQVQATTARWKATSVSTWIFVNAMQGSGVKHWESLHVVFAEFHYAFSKCLLWMRLQVLLCGHGATLLCALVKCHVWF